jgi:tRNA dimethylallyltransferase
MKLLAIVGPTASGKTDLAIQIARQHGGEVICADSRTVYRSMDVGTAKPTAAERAGVPHHLLDVVAPNQPFSAAEFQRLATRAIASVQHRGKLPILVGGTGLYVNAILYDYQFPAGANAERRAELEKLPTVELLRRLEQADPERAAAIDRRNPRRVVRALETAGLPRIAPKALPASTLVVGLNPGLPELERRIAARTEQQLAGGLIAETQRLLRRYEALIEPLNTVPYRETIQFLRGEIDRHQLAELISLHNRQLAKRQLTWFKRNPDIHWEPDAAGARAIIAAWL